jgi:hypothetical protein
MDVLMDWYSGLSGGFRSGFDFPTDADMSFSYRNGFL